MEIIEGNLLDISHGIVVHQVNCQGVMGRGLAAQLRARYPIVFKEYNKLCRSKVGFEADLLGSVQLVPIKENPSLRVANMFGQLTFAGPGIHTDYDAVSTALEKLSFINTRKLPIYVPYMLGCGLGGGDWRVVSEIIEEYLPSAIIVKLDS